MKSFRAQGPEVHGPSVGMLAVRVAMAASAVVAVAYLLIAVFVAIVVSNNLTADVDRHLDQSLNVVGNNGGPGGLPDGGALGGPGFDPSRQDPRAVPVLLWVVKADGSAAGQGLNDLQLPAADRAVTAPTTALAAMATRTASMPTEGPWTSGPGARNDFTLPPADTRRREP